MNFNRFLLLYKYTRAGRKTWVLHSAGKTPAIFLGVFMKELSVFVDGFGDFGEYDYHAPFYIISFILHNQEVDISEDVAKLIVYMWDLQLEENMNTQI